MRTLSIIAYAIGTALLIASCFTQNVALTWWLGAVALTFLIMGCIFQFNAKKTVSRSYVRQPIRHDKNRI